MPTCRQCKHDFPNLVVIDGKRRNLQHRTVCLECVPFQSAEAHSRKASLPRKAGLVSETVCSWRGCRRKFQSHNYVIARNGSVFCSDRCKNIANIDHLRTQRKRDAVDYKGGKCEICGYNRCLASLHFHHIGKGKDFNINRGMTMEWSKIKKELDRCQLLCANCHAEVHHGLLAPM